MEVDFTIVSKEELDYWCKEYPDLDREEVLEILECIDVSYEKEEYWKNNPTLNEEAVDKVVAENAAASYVYHVENNEAQ